MREETAMRPGEPERAVKPPPVKRKPRIKRWWYENGDRRNNADPKIHR